MCLILSLGIVGPLMNFTTYINETKAIEYAVHDVDELLHAEELPDTGKPVEVPSKDIQLQDVSFSYDKESGKQVLSHINLKIPEGKFTALVGPSGGGKSTVARLIARFWDVNDGKITIGGVDIRSMPLAQLAILSVLLHRITSCLTAPSRKISGWETLMLRTKKYMRQQKPPAVMNLYRNWTMAMTRWPEMRETGFQVARNSASPLRMILKKCPYRDFGRGNCVHRSGERRKNSAVHCCFDKRENFACHRPSSVHHQKC